MELFSSTHDPDENLLPFDGEVYYYGIIISGKEADDLLGDLLEKIEWRNDEAVIFGRRIITKRKVAWYGDTNFQYTYSKVTRTALSWTPELLKLKEIVERITGETYNSCLLNLYHDGSEGMAWHSDAEKDLKKFAAIASMSFGAERKFAFKHKKTGDTRTLLLQHGSLLVMKADTQENWLHRIPVTKKVASPRVNLTFRTVQEK
jgi:alkylated DNA repair dioxygenase AlkB